MSNLPTVPVQNSTALQAFTPTVVIPETGLFEARKNLPPGVNASDIENNARQLAANPAFTVPEFVNLVRAHSSLTAGLDAMLENVKARDAGEVGQVVLDVTTRTGDFSKRVPRPKADFMLRVEQKVASAQEILNVVKWLADQIKRYRAGFESLRDLIEQKRVYLSERADVSLEASVRDWTLSEDEDQREQHLLKLTALIEYLGDAIDQQLRGQLDETNKKRLLAIKPLVTPRLSALRVMIQAAQISAKRFAVQSGSNGLTAMKFRDFAGPGVDTWMANVAAQLDAITNIAENLAMSGVDAFMVDQAEAAVNAVTEQVDSMAALLRTQVASIVVIEHATTALVEAGDTILAALQEAEVNAKEVQRTIADSRARVAESEKKLAAEVARL